MRSFDYRTALRLNDNDPSANGALHPAPGWLMVGTTVLASQTYCGKDPSGSSRRSACGPLPDTLCRDGDSIRTASTLT